ncbi:hypothetical protein [Paraburkholderia caribensis]|uniref:hypothetical protein n=1 Tax=Paraburkholderia caribensis TaxID=75105 RepID=UPI00078C58CD|nr:hypothetical protein [Paraburkholderia caribensis]AMV48206.1 hypothetical protein ATN79_46930 [Paraburkholderia caribensis]
MNVVDAVSQPSFIPLGLMMPASEHKGANSRVKGIVLEQMVNFDPLSYTNARRSVFDVFLVGTTGEPLLMFFLQIEDARLVWLANPAEPEVWKAIDIWRANGSVSVALSNSDNSTHLFVIPFRRLDESVLALRRSNRFDADTLTIDAIALLTTGAIDGFDFPGLPAPARSAACLLHTPRVDRVLKRLGYRAGWDAEARAFHARRIVDLTPVANKASLSIH